MDAVSWAISLIFSGMLAVIAIQCMIAIVASGKADSAVDHDQPRLRVAVLVPAHNEATGIEPTLRQIKASLRAGDRCVVVADNCSDDTAAVARATGVEVLERYDQTNRGKGFALDAGVRFLEPDPPEVLIIVDADCDVDSDAIELLTRSVAETNRPAQALYLMRMPIGGGPEAAVSVFAFLIKNWVRARAMHCLGLPVLLTGTGMAFPWVQIREAKLASAELVEDLALGLLLTRQGHGPVFCEHAHVQSDLPSDLGAAIEQRTRWEHGYLSTILREVPPLLLTGLFRFQPTLLAVAIDLSVPPLALLAIGSMLAWLVLCVLSLWTMHWLPLAILSVAGAMAILFLAIAFVRFGRAKVPVAALASIPTYVWRKLGIYHRFVGKRQTEWVRTARDAESQK